MIHIYGGDDTYLLPIMDGLEIEIEIDSILLGCTKEKLQYCKFMHELMRSDYSQTKMNGKKSCELLNKHKNCTINLIIRSDVSVCECMAPARCPPPTLMTMRFHEIVPLHFYINSGAFKNSNFLFIFQMVMAHWQK